MRAQGNGAVFPDENGDLPSFIQNNNSSLVNQSTINSSNNPFMDAINDGLFDDDATGLLDGLKGGNNSMSPPG